MNIRALHGHVFVNVYLARVVFNIQILNFDLMTHFAHPSYYNMTSVDTSYSYISAMLSGVARAFSGGRAAHPEDQNEEENEENLRKNERHHRKMRIG